MRFAGLKGKVTFDVKGDFHRDIRGTRIQITGDGDRKDGHAARRMDGFAKHQTGNAGDITAGLPPHDYGDAAYIEWYDRENGRVVIEPRREQMKVLGQLLPWQQWEPISREQQSKQMAEFLGNLARECRLPPERVLCISVSGGPDRPDQNTGSKSTAPGDGTANGAGATDATGVWGREDAGSKGAQ